MDSSPATSQSAPETITANLRMILRVILAGLGNWAIDPAILATLYRRISATFRRTERLLLRFQAGKLWRITKRETAAPRPRVSRKPAIVLPRNFGWLIMSGKHHAAYVRSQLQAQLDTPEMTALLASSEQARRVLRPLCRALAMEMEWVVGAPKETKGQRKPRTRTPRPKPEPFRIPLPRGMLSWARREGFGKMR